MALLLADVGPYLVNLDPATWKLAHLFVHELCATIADLDEKAYRNFAITDDAVIFFFGQNQVVPDNAGPHKVAVPRSELASMLA